MDEYIDLANEQGKFIGRKELKSVIHQKGHYHHTAHIWLYTNKGEIILSQRSAKKTICPLLWDVSVAGHIDAGETIVDGALREMQEEIGLTLSENDLLKIGTFKCFQNYDSGIKDYEFHNTFIAELKVPLSKLKPQLEEVENLKLVSFSEFEQLLEQSETNGHFVASNRAYYETVLKSTQDRLQKSN